MEPDTYLTIKAFSQGLYKEKGSRFIALAYPVFNQEEIKSILEKSEKNIIMQDIIVLPGCSGRDRQTFRVNDDGEPSGTPANQYWDRSIPWTYKYSYCCCKIFWRETSWC